VIATEWRTYFSSWFIVDSPGNRGAPHNSLAMGRNEMEKHNGLLDCKHGKKEHECGST
jgi:hypothetical protein